MPSLGRGFSGSNPVYGYAVGFQGRILFMAVLWVFRAESCLWLCCGFSGPNPVYGCAVGFQGRILFMAVSWVSRVKSCVWLCHGFSGTKYNIIVWSGTKCNIMVCIRVLILGTVLNIVLWFGSAPIKTLLLGLVTNAILCSGVVTKCNNILARYHSSNIVVSTTNSDTGAKCNNIEHDKIVCDNDNDWSHPGNGAKYGTIVVTVLLLWSYVKCISR